MPAKIIPFKQVAQVKKTDKDGKARTPKRFDWITDADMEEINEIDTRGREFDYNDRREEE